MVQVCVTTFTFLTWPQAGDIATCYASPEKAKEVLGWEAKKTLKEMVRDSWRWQKTNPNGYED